MLVDPRTSASTPGQISLNIPRYLKLKPWLVVPAALGIVIAVAMMALSQKPKNAGIALAVGVGTTVLMPFQTRAKFRSGCLLPGCIVSVDPLLVASVTDLSTGRSERAFSAVSIAGANAAAFPDGGQSLKVGDPCPVCALYHGNLKAAHWNSFDPEPVWVATDQMEVVADAVKRLDPAEWKDLKRALQQVPRPLKPGRYRVDLSSENGGAPSGWPPDKIGKKL